MTHTPVSLPTGLNPVLSTSSQSAYDTDTIIHCDNNVGRYALKDDTIKKVYNSQNRNWLDLHESLLCDKDRKLFDMDIIVKNKPSNNTESANLSINVDKKCMTELVLLDDTKVLCLFDTGSTVNLISESLVNNSLYLSKMKIMQCNTQHIRNSSGEFSGNNFIEICFKVKDDFILSTTALIIPDFGSVKFILSTTSIMQLNSVVDLASQ